MKVRKYSSSSGSVHLPATTMGSPAPPGRVDGQVHPLVRVEPAEEEHHVLLVGAEREAGHVDGVVHGSPPGEVRGGAALRRGDGDEGDGVAQLAGSTPPARRRPGRAS